MATNGNPRQKRAIAALLAEPNVKAAAASAGVGYRTILRWLEDPIFRAALTQAEDQAIDSAVRLLAGAGADAVATMTAIMADVVNAPGVRLRAAGMVLDTLLKLRELRTLADRIQALEAIYATGDE